MSARALLVPRAELKRIVDAAEAAYPREACGLLIGRIEDDGARRVSRIAESANVDASGRLDRFEIDARAYIETERGLRGSAESVIGLYHSHCDFRAQPSTLDLELAWEPRFVWLIVAVEGGQAIHATAHALSGDERRFEPLPLLSDDWEPYPERPPGGRS